MRICKVWDADYPWDVRVEKVTAAFSGAGWHVDLVCRNEKRSPRLERHGLLHIHRLPYLPPSFSRLNRLVNFPYFLNPVWIANILQVSRQTRPNVLLVRDLPLALTGITAARLLRIPVVLDLAENYPAMLRDKWKWGPLRPLDVLVRNPKIAAWVERYALPRVDYVIVVVEESASRVVSLGVDPWRVSVVRNTPPRDRADGWSRPVRPTDLPEGEPLLMYLGNLDAGRGVDTLLAAMPRVLRAAPRAHLVIIGAGTQLGRLRAQASELRVQDAVTFLGWVPYARAHSYLASADVCLIPHASTESNNTTISNKLFDYMAAGKPVVASDCPPTARMIQSVGCGLTFPAGDPSALAGTVEELLDPGIREVMGRKGKEAVRNTYNWERDSEELIKVLTMASNRSSKALAMASDIRV